MWQDIVEKDETSDVGQLCVRCDSEWTSKSKNVILLYIKLTKIVFV